MTTARLLSACLLVAAACGEAKADAAASAAGRPDETVHYLTGSPAADLRTGVAGSGVTVDTGAHYGHVDATLSRQIGRLSSDGEVMGFTTISLKATKPFDTSASTTSFLADDGVANAVTLQVALGHVFIPLGDNNLDPATDRSFQQAAKAKCLATKPAGATGWKCDNAHDLLKWLDRREVDDLANKVGWTGFLGASGTIGYKDYDVHDTLTFARGKLHRLPYALSAQGGATFSGTGFPNGWFFGVIGHYRQEYAAAPKEIRCQAGNVQQCVDASFLAPVLVKSASLILVARRQTVLPFGIDRPVGWQLKAGRDFNRGVWGGEAALYVALDKHGKYAGGAKFRIESGDGDPVTLDMRHKLSVFVGTSF